MLLERLKKQSGLSDSQLERLAATASKRYKVYQIPKRTGGARTIEQPTQEIKAIQRWLVRALIGRFPVHSCATAYKNGASIRENAFRHAKSNFTLRVDFKSFFPSFSAEHVERFLREKSTAYNIEISAGDIYFARRIVCRREALTIGAPSSPGLTNAMMCDFDTAVSSWCLGQECVYTRYADDIFISTQQPGLLNDALSVVIDCAEQYRFATLVLNNEKTAFLSRKYRRSITGIVITTARDVSIGRDRKARLKSEIYRYAEGRLSAEQLERVRGMLAFARDVEPTFYATVIRKYGRATIEGIEALRGR